MRKGRIYAGRDRSGRQVLTDRKDLAMGDGGDVEGENSGNSQNESEGAVNRQDGGNRARGCTDVPFFVRIGEVSRYRRRSSTF